jgi:polysaccharide pyruvyl transferase WcaK-like protein
VDLVKIVVDSCSYNCQNVGDLAMLTVAVRRLRELWPEAAIRVITNSPQHIARHCGAVGTVPVRGRRQLLEESLLGSGRHWLPPDVRQRWDRFEARLRLQQPALFAASIKIKGLVAKREVADAAEFLAAVRGADLVVVNGAGIMTDAFAESALGILATLDFAIRRGIPTALFGQGLGPIVDTELRRRAAEVLPRTTLIGVRESQTGVALLASLGVDPSRVKVTGDDAIELAYAAIARRRPHPEGPAIGVNVRVAAYADVEHGMLSTLKSVFARASRMFGARLVPVPIAHHGGRMDIETLRELLGGQSDGGAGLDTPDLVIDRVGECRVVVTGSYHGAVFALAQGIPVVALANSPYYVHKMSGVADQFGLGCEVVRLDQPDVETRLLEAVERAWHSADHVREPLLAAATAQIERGRSAYAELRQYISPAATARSVHRPAPIPA